MIGVRRIATWVTVILAAFLLPALCASQTPFDGTWRIQIDKSRFSPKPMVIFLSEGWFHCKSCNPQLDIRADGTDQQVLGQTYDTISVREIDPRTTHILIKKAGKVLIDETQSASTDGRVLTVKTTEHPTMGGAVVTAVTKAVRIGIASAAINRTSGSWRLKSLAQSENGLLTTYKSNGDEFTMTAPSGETYTAKFNGMDFPVTGAAGHNVVALKRIDNNTFEEINKREGTVVKMARITVTAGGKKMMIVNTNTMTDRTTTYFAVKQ